jgi:hypothetical protein
MRRASAVFALALACSPAFAANSAEKPKSPAETSGSAGPVPKAVVSVLRKHMQTAFLDPESARYRVTSGPTKHALASGVVGYRVCVAINAKNRLGGYTGEQPYMFLLKGDAVIFDARAEMLRLSLARDYKSSGLASDELRKCPGVTQADMDKAIEQLLRQMR